MLPSPYLLSVARIYWFYRFKAKPITAVSGQPAEESYHENKDTSMESSNIQLQRASQLLYVMNNFDVVTVYMINTITRLWLLEHTAVIQNIKINIQLILAKCWNKYERRIA